LIGGHKQPPICQTAIGGVPVAAAQLTAAVFLLGAVSIAFAAYVRDRLQMVLAAWAAHPRVQTRGNVEVTERLKKPASAKAIADEAQKSYDPLHPQGSRTGRLRPHRARRRSAPGRKLVSGNMAAALLERADTGILFVASWRRGGSALHSSNVPTLPPAGGVS